MKEITILLTLAWFAVGCSATKLSPHATREEAQDFLQAEGLLAEKHTIVSAEWHDDSSNWLFIVDYESTSDVPVKAHWFVNSTATEYSGGTCKH